MIEVTEELRKVQRECDEISRQTVLHYLGRDEKAEQKQLEEIAEKVSRECKSSR